MDGRSPDLNSSPLYFLHIPKTAGTTLYNNLDDRFELDQICPARFLAELLKLSPDEIQRYCFFRGHFGYSLQNFVERPLTYITVLRDPVERCISQFEDVRRVPNNFLHQRVKEQQMTFADFARDAETHIALRNLQARNLAFDWTADQMDGNVELIRRGIAGTILELSDDELLDIAKGRLRQCAVVGVVERFQETTALLSYRFQWYPIRPPRRLNQSAHRLKRESLDTDTVAAVQELNQVDEALYRYATQLFEEQYEAMLQELPPADSLEAAGTEIGWMEAEFVEFTSGTSGFDSLESDSSKSDPPESKASEPDPLTLRMPALVQRYAQTRAQQASFESVLNLSMRRTIAGANWHSREGLDKGCTTFRWTGPGTTSTLHLPLKAEEDLRVQIYLVRAIAPDVLQSLSLSVQGNGIPLQLLTAWETHTVFQGVIPKALLASPPTLTRLEIRVNRTESMQTIAPHSPDQRRVGLAVSHLYLFPHRQVSAPGHSTPVPEDEELRLFPNQDQMWTDVLDFVRSHHQPDEAIAAPKEFLQPFPQPFRDYRSLTPDSLPDWAIIAKHLTRTLDESAIRQMTAELRPVYSNPVFLVLSRRSDLPTVSYFEDPPWEEVADFLAAHLQPGEALAAPEEFIYRFPEALRSRNPTQTGATDTPWVVFHKGRLDAIPVAVLNPVVRDLRPVFANLVFVIFSSRTDLKAVPPWVRDMRAFWKLYSRRRLQQVIRGQ